MTRIAILDYGMGNLRSVEKALEHSGVEAEVTDSAMAAHAADGVVLPGVGAFPRAMKHIRELGFDLLVREVVAENRPVLGICLGMQLLFDGSEEHGGDEGLGLIPGPVTALEADGLSLPHIGWEAVTVTGVASPLVAGMGADEAFYFNHSFAARPKEEGDTVAISEWGERFACLVQRGSVYGAQFHPEKSSLAGLKMLANFAALCG